MAEAISAEVNHLNVFAMRGASDRCDGGSGGGGEPRQQKEPVIHETPDDEWAALLRCPLCLGYFDDPRVLPCGHTFCYNCLRGAGLHQVRIRRQHELNVGGQTVLVDCECFPPPWCPFCRRSVSNHSLTKAAGTRNFNLAWIVDHWRRSRPAMERDDEPPEQFAADVEQSMVQLSSDSSSLASRTMALHQPTPDDAEQRTRAAVGYFAALARSAIEHVDALRLAIRRGRRSGANGDGATLVPGRSIWSLLKSVAIRSLTLYARSYGLM